MAITSDARECFYINKKLYEKLYETAEKEDMKIGQLVNAIFRTADMDELPITYTTNERISSNEYRKFDIRIKQIYKDKLKSIVSQEQEVDKKVNKSDIFTILATNYISKIKNS